MVKINWLEIIDPLKLSMNYGLVNLPQNIDFYLELAPPKSKLETGSTEFTKDGSPFNHQSVLYKKLLHKLPSVLLHRVKNICLDYEYYLQ